MLISAAWSLLYIFLDVVPSNFCRTILGVQLDHCLVCLPVSKSIFSAIQYIVVSSAYRQVSGEPSDFGRSFVKSENNVGPRTDPCGTPWVIMCVSESHLLILTNCLRSVKQFFNHSQTSPLIPRSFSFCSNILCDTVSKALLKSTNSIPTKAFLLLLLSTSQLGVLKAVLLTFPSYKPIVCYQVNFA